MQRLVWFGVAAILALWSGLAWIVHSLIGIGGGFAARNADIVPSPEAVEWLSWLSLFGTSLGEWIVLAIWAIGAGLLLLFGFAGTRLLPYLRSYLDKAKFSP
jgi:hypothetical protein